MLVKEGHSFKIYTGRFGENGLFHGEDGMKYYFPVTEWTRFFFRDKSPYVNGSVHFGELCDVLVTSNREALGIRYHMVSEI